MAAELGVDEVVKDADGDIPISSGTSLTYVRVHDDDLPMVRIFAYLLTGLEKRPELYEAANEISLSVMFAKALVVEDGTAMVLAAEIPADSLSPGELVGTLEMVMDAADPRRLDAPGAFRRENCSPRSG